MSARVDATVRQLRVVEHLATLLRENSMLPQLRWTVTAATLVGQPAHFCTPGEAREHWDAWVAALQPTWRRTSPEQLYARVMDQGSGVTVVIRAGVGEDR